MTGLLMCAVLLSLSVHQSQACYLVINPVCGSNGQTYQNECFLNSAKGANPNLTKVHDGACNETQQSYSSSCICYLLVKEVCGSDGVTYTNECFLRCAQKKDSGLTKAHDGICIQEVANSKAVCSCTKEYRPICGTDGRTYGNNCTLHCQQQIDPDLEQAYLGECKKVAVNLKEAAACACTKEYWPICGTDGQTYGNNCTFYCQKQIDQGLEEAYLGECKEQMVTIPEDEGCICTLQWEPVCGTDGLTYGNKCQLGCQIKLNPDLKEAHDGQCGKGPLISDVEVACTAEWAPVCGTDNRTYGNMCELNRWKKFNPDLKKAYDGECGKSSFVSDVEKACTEEWAPVCGTDNQTYGNMCELNHQKEVNPDLEKAYDGECNEPMHGTLPCDCPEFKDIICGSDGNTYDNMCSLQCHQKYDPGLKKDGDGPC